MRKSKKQKVVSISTIFILIPVIIGIGVMGFNLKAIYDYKNVNNSLIKTPVGEFWTGDSTLLREKARDLEYRLFTYHMDGQGLML
ncbi:MAG: hypothetical protein ACTSU9_08235, partial [Promethearchaeota archaeon]